MNFLRDTVKFLKLSGYTSNDEESKRDAGKAPEPYIELLRLCPSADDTDEIAFA